MSFFQNARLSLGVTGDLRKEQFLTLTVNDFYCAGFRATASIKRDDYGIAPYEVTLHPRGNPDQILGFYHVHTVHHRA